MKLDCYRVDGAPIDIHPAQSRRPWIDEMPATRAYHCLPLTIANSHGWELRCLQKVTARWTGGVRPEDVEVTREGERVQEVAGHFGSGILTFGIRSIFRTEAGTNLWVMGPTNRFKDGIQPMSAMVETDWIPFTFTMNWKFTRPDCTVTFEKGEPYCFIFPVQHGLIEAFEPRLKAIEDDAELHRQYKIGARRRQLPSVLSAERGEETRSITRLRTQEWYKRGKMPDGKTPGGPHLKTLAVKPFK